MKKIIFILIILSVNLLATNKVDNLILFKVISEKEIIKPNIEMIKTSLEANLTSLGYGIIDEKIQEEALKEQKKQQSSDCYDDQCLVDTGRMLTAKKLLIIRVSKKSDNNFYSIL